MKSLLLDQTPSLQLRPHHQAPDPMSLNQPRPIIAATTTTPRRRILPKPATSNTKTAHLVKIMRSIQSEDTPTLSKITSPLAHDHPRINKPQQH
jgi:hypothetical protein